VLKKKKGGAPPGVKASETQIKVY